MKIYNMMDDFVPLVPQLFHNFLQLWNTQLINNQSIIPSVPLVPQLFNILVDTSKKEEKKESVGVIENLWNIWN